LALAPPHPAANCKDVAEFSILLSPLTGVALTEIDDRENARTSPANRADVFVKAIC